MCSDASRTRDTVCQHPSCHRSVWQDPDGSYSAYCGASHRDAMRLLSGGLVPAATSVSLCKHCATRPVYIQDGKEHDFCGIRCSKAFREGTENPASPRVSLAPTSPSICKLPTCQKLAFVGSTGEASEYCGTAHRREAVTSGVAEKCLRCLKWPKIFSDGRMSDFCSKRCSDNTINIAPVILNVSDDMKAYIEVAKQFRDQWRHPTRAPTVVKIWKIFCDNTHNDEFARYRLSVERARGLPGGNSRRRWHGTVRACTVGDADAQGFACNSAACSLCGIIRTSFRVAKAGQNTNFGRFGAGIYTSATSSKANSYVVERGGSPYRAVLLSDVVLGKAMKLKTDKPGLTEAPSGHDSVIGEPGRALNYDEAIVYKNEAIRPLFLVIYQ